MIEYVVRQKYVRWCLFFFNRTGYFFSVLLVIILNELKKITVSSFAHK